jgi:hypothetical protein
MFKQGNCIGVGTLASVLALMALACSSEAQDHSTTVARSNDLTEEETEVARYLEFNGVTDYEFRRAEDSVIIEKDSLASFSELLGKSRSFDYSQEPVEKGYWFGSKVGGQYTSRVTRPIRLVFAANVPTAWRTAFNNAAAEWNAAQCVTYTSVIGGNTTTTTVNMVDLGAKANGVYAQAPYPSFINGQTPAYQAGQFVNINSTYGCASGSCAINNLSASLKEQVALHELGHTLGFTHPQVGTFLTGTPNGATVMVASFGEPGIANLTTDDVSSRDRVYKLVQGSCASTSFP